MAELEPLSKGFESMLTLKDKGEIWYKNLQFCRQAPGWAYRCFWPGGNPFVEGFHRWQTIFVHIPKAAGSSVSNALFGEPVGHRPIRRHLAYAPDLVDKYFTFTFVRNPWDRLYSGYHYFARRTGSDGHRDHRWASVMLSEVSSFSEFVFLLEDPAYVRKLKRYDHFRDQVDWLVDPGSGELIMDFIGRFETLENDFLYVSHCLDIQVTLPHLRQGQQGAYLKAYDAHMVEIVQRLYATDIERLGYEFGG